MTKLVENIHVDLVYGGDEWHIIICASYYNTEFI